MCVVDKQCSNFLTQASLRRFIVLYNQFLYCNVCLLLGKSILIEECECETQSGEESASFLSSSLHRTAFLNTPQSERISQQQLEISQFKIPI